MKESSEFTVREAASVQLTIDASRDGLHTRSQVQAGSQAGINYLNQFLVGQCLKMFLLEKHIDLYKKVMFQPRRCLTSTYATSKNMWEGFGLRGWKTSAQMSIFIVQSQLLTQPGQLNNSVQINWGDEMTMCEKMQNFHR